MGAATAGDGKVLFAPFNAHAVGIFDPTTDGVMVRHCNAAKPHLQTPGNQSLR